MTYSRLSELDTTRDNWLVRVRVCKMWEFRNYKRGNEMINLDMVLINEENQVSKFRHNLSKGSVIIIGNFKFIQPNMIRSRVNNNCILSGEITFASTAASKTHVNFLMDNINSLIQNLNASNIPMEEAMFVNRMIVSELLDSNWSYDIEECMVTWRAQITKIDSFFDWYYISYNGGKTTLDLFNGLPSQIEALCSKEFVFKLKLSKYNLKEGLENYTVTKMYLPDEQLELQHHINKDKKVMYHKCRSSHTYTSKENAGEGEGTSSSNIRVNARKLKKRRKFLIEERDSDEATNKNVNLKA
ncbi:hypothetical protein R3W88_011542 [Solanum pinnatisectum]|uniref:DUF223 domain-containing protein n=1 Tax=Solanum pinnatisectum TaxID=50273 RepID=A0AAV9L928_9SOLN|nr:hypothetical protein R3W88_011542 [Solanum pinnatisectum]